MNPTQFAQAPPNSGWNCSCGFYNFEYRNECLKCGNHRLTFSFSPLPAYYPPTYQQYIPAASPEIPSSLGGLSGSGSLAGSRASGMKKWKEARGSGRLGGGVEKNKKTVQRAAVDPGVSALLIRTGLATGRFVETFNRASGILALEISENDAAIAAKKEELASLRLRKDRLMDLKERLQDQPSVAEQIVENEKAKKIKEEI